MYADTITESMQKAIDETNEEDIFKKNIIVCIILHRQQLKRKLVKVYRLNQIISMKILMK